MSSDSSDETVPPNDPPKEVFLDTSIHLAWLKGPDLKQKVDNTLSEFDFIGTSTYVKLEYGNVILSFAQYCQRMLKEKGSLEKLRYHITNKLWVEKSPTNRSYHTWFFNLLADNFSHPESTERAERTLRSLLCVGTEAISDLCDDVQDGIQCLWAEKDSSKGWKSPSNCHKKAPGCRIDSFFEENKDCFCKIRDAIRRMQENGEEVTWQLSNFADVIDKACQSPNSLRDYKNGCKKLADAIIAVQSKGYRSFFTQNIKESIVLCKELKQLLLYLEQDLEKPVIYRDFRE